MLSLISWIKSGWRWIQRTRIGSSSPTPTSIPRGRCAVCGFFGGRPIDRTGIELVRSINGGATWSAPLVIDQTCGAPFVQGSQMVVGPGGEVYVAWEFFAADFVTRSLRIRRSTNNGVTFGPTAKVDDVTCVGECFRLQGGFRSGFEFPSLAVDRSGTAANGTVYLAWHDGRNLLVPDFGSFSGFYGYADVLVRRSTNGDRKSVG